MGGRLAAWFAKSWSLPDGFSKMGKLVSCSYYCTAPQFIMEPENNPGRGDCELGNHHVQVSCLKNFGDVVACYEPLSSNRIYCMSVSFKIAKIFAGSHV